MGKRQTPSWTWYSSAFTRVLDSRHRNDHNVWQPSSFLIDLLPSPLYRQPICAALLNRGFKNTL